MAGNVINTGLNLMNTAYNGAGGTVISGDAVKGGYFVTDTIANIPSWSNVTGTLCYCTNDSKFYQYNGSSWQEKEFGTNSIATSSALGLVKSSTTGTTSNRDYAVEVKSDGTMKVNVPWTDTNTQDGNDNQKVKAGSVTFGVNDVVNIVAGSNVSVTGDATNKKITIAATDTTYSSKTAASGGTAVSLVTTGEKYTWNNKADAHSHPYLSTSGGTLSGMLNANGNITISNSNPHIGFTSNGVTAYLQTYNDNDGLGEKVGFGYGWSNSLKLDSTGNIYEKGTSLENKYAPKSHTHSYSTTDTKNTAGSTNTTSKIYLVGATSQAANPQTYSNSSCYASNGYLYSGGTKVSVEGHTHSYSSTDTKNTTGSTDTDSKIYLVGATSQAANPQTYSHVEVFVDTSHYVNASGFKATSDRRLKENIKEFKTEKSILDLPVVEFDYRQTKQHTIGCIAQDLQEICPEIVSEGDDGYLRIEEDKIVYLLLNEVKKLKSEVELLKQKNN